MPFHEQYGRKKLQTCKNQQIPIYEEKKNIFLHNLISSIYGDSLWPTCNKGCNSIFSTAVSSTISKNIVKIRVQNAATQQHCLRDNARGKKSKPQDTHLPHSCRMTEHLPRVNFHKNMKVQHQIVYCNSTRCSEHLRKQSLCSLCHPHLKAGSKSAGHQQREAVWQQGAPIIARKLYFGTSARQNSKHGSTIRVPSNTAHSQKQLGLFHKVMSTRMSYALK